MCRASSRGHQYLLSARGIERRPSLHSAIGDACDRRARAGCSVLDLPDERPLARCTQKLTAIRTPVSTLSRGRAAPGSAGGEWQALGQGTKSTGATRGRQALPGDSPELVSPLRSGQAQGGHVSEGRWRAPQVGLTAAARSIGPRPRRSAAAIKGSKRNRRPGSKSRRCAVRPALGLDADMARTTLGTMA